MSHLNYRLTSLLDMYRFDAAAYHKAIGVITEALVLLKNASPQFAGHVLNEQSALGMLMNLRDLKQCVELLSVPATRIAIQEFEEKLDVNAQFPATFAHGIRLLTEISETLRREMKATQVFVLDSAKATYYDPPQSLFGADVAAKFPGLAYDLSEAGKCLALERSTAAAFHAIRALEGGITAMSRCLGIPDPTKGADRSWGAMLGKIDTEIKRRWDKAARMSGDGQTFEGLHGALAGMQNPYRNATMHLDQIYTAEDAKHVFEMVGGILRKIAFRMDESGLPLA